MAIPDKGRHTGVSGNLKGHDMKAQGNARGK